MGTRYVCCNVFLMKNRLRAVSARPYKTYRQNRIVLPVF